jgi:hypothetical protein
MIPCSAGVAGRTYHTPRVSDRAVSAGRKRLVSGANKSSPQRRTVLIVAGLALVGVSTWSRAEASEKTTQAGALIIVVGAFLLGLSIFVSHGK